MLKGYSKYTIIKCAMKHYVYELSSIDDFVIEWRSFTEKFGLLLNEWLSVLFQEYQRWIPFFLKIDFWAGMSTIQRSESLNAFFDGYINTIMILQQFVKQYENALQDNVEKEYEVDFASMNTIIPCESKLLIERQFQVEYIHPKFHEVQAAFRGKINCNVGDVSCLGCAYSYDVTEATIVSFLA